MTDHPIDTEALRVRAEHVYRHGGPANAVESLAANVPAILDRLAAAEHRADKAEKVHRDLTSSLGFGDGITEPMADNKTIIQHVGEAVTDAQELWELTQAACVEAGCDSEEDCYDHHPVRRAERAEHRATRAEAQSAIRGRAVVIYRERAREAEAERDGWRQTALDERGAALDTLEQIKARDARIKAVQDVLDTYSYKGAFTGKEQCRTDLIRRALEG